jgi:hypothetical protein
MNIVDWLPLLGTLVVAIVTLVGFARQRKKDDAETSDKISSAWERLLAPYDDRITRLEASNLLLSTENRMLWAYINDLRVILSKNNITAPPMPLTDKFIE